MTFPPIEIKKRYFIEKCTKNVVLFNESGEAKIRLISQSFYDNTINDFALKLQIIWNVTIHGDFSWNTLFYSNGWEWVFNITLNE